MISHAQPYMGPLGTLSIESKRHFLDYAEMTDEESASPGDVLRKINEFLAQDDSYSEKDAIVLAGKLREEMR